MAEPDFDKNIGDDGVLTVIQAINACREESHEAKTTRLAKNLENRDAFLGRQDWSTKVSGQSTEFLPKVPVAAEQMVSVFKRGLLQGGDFFSCEVSPALSGAIYGPQIVNLINIFLDNLWAPNGAKTNFQTVIGDAIKNGLLESLIILKVHGGAFTSRSFKYSQGDVHVDKTGRATRTPRLDENERDEWRLRIDLVRPEDYFPDPTGNRLYEIHEVERDLHEVLAMAEDGVYDKKAVNMLINEDNPRSLDDRRPERAMNQDTVTTPKFRKRVTLREFWGTLLNADGTVAHRNVVATVANETYLIRPPEPNPFWHQESPFVVAPLIRVPWSVWHKALFDDAAALNLAINEVFNLILDGGMASVWGTRQVRLDDLEDPSQVEGGIQQGATLAVKATLPHNAKVLETVTEGNVPQDAMMVFEFLNREFAQAALTNEIKMGNLPTKQVRATEVVEANQSQGATLDSLVGDVEKNVIEEVIRKSFYTILQNADNIPTDVLRTGLDMKTALLILRASPEERFSTFYGMANFRVFGLTAMMTKAKDFQKLMAMMQSVTANPLLMQQFMKRFSAEKTLMRMMQALGVNPNDLLMTPEEAQQAAMDQQQLPQIAQMMGLTSGTQGGSEGATTGEPGMQSDVSQQANPITGMTPNG